MSDVNRAPPMINEQRAAQFPDLSAIPDDQLQRMINEKRVQKGKDAGVYGAFVSGFSSNEDETVRYLARRIYPDEPIEAAVKRFGKKDGALYHISDDGGMYEALPGGWGPRGMAAGLARGAGPAIPAATGTAAGAVTLPLATTGVGLVATMGAAGGAASAGDVARQKIGDYLMGDASTGAVDPSSVVQEGVMGATGQGIGKGLNVLAQRGAVKDITRYNPTTTRQAYDDAARVDVPITPAEATGLPTLQAQQKRLSNITATSDDMRKFTEYRNGKVLNAWQGFLDIVSRSADAEDVGIMARKTADSVLKGLRDEAKAAAKPLYDAAYSKPVPFTTELETMLKKPVMRDALRSAKELSENEGITSRQFFMQFGDDGTVKVSRVPDMREWDYIKRGLDEVLGSDKAMNKQTGGMNNFGRIVSGIKGDLTKILDDAVPEYGQARSVYADGAEDVTNAMQSAIGLLAKTKDVNILSAARHLFDPRSRSPQMVLKLRNAMEAESPEAWQAVKRLYMQDVTTDALRITEAGEIANPAGKIFKAFSNPRILQNMSAAMEPAEFDRMKELLVVFRRAASVPAMRSDTEWNRLINIEAESQARPLGSKLIRNINPATALNSLSDWMTERNLDKQAKTIVDLVTSGDPQVIEIMKELKQLSTTQKNFILGFGHLLTRGAGKVASGAIAPETDYAPNQRPN